MLTFTYLVKSLNIVNCPHHSCLPLLLLLLIFIDIILIVPNPQLSMLHNISHWCILQVNAVQDVYLQIVYLFDIIDEHCIYFVLMMTFGIIFESFLDKISDFYF